MTADYPRLAPIGAPQRGVGERLWTVGLGLALLFALLSDAALAQQKPLAVDVVATAKDDFVRLDLDKDFCSEPDGGCPIIRFVCAERTAGVVFEYTAIGIGSFYGGVFQPTVLLTGNPDARFPERISVSFRLYSITRADAEGYSWKGVYDTDVDRERVLEALSSGPRFEVHGPPGYLQLHAAGQANVREFEMFASRCAAVGNDAG
ncbi:hypothetical protein [Bauldia sp.]|uniref:hypothetical protein n=1 Tax=Bauldia sp. TaxID=2575872 RepID=UPI003BABF65B